MRCRGRQSFQSLPFAQSRFVEGGPRWEFTVTGKPDFKAGVGAPGPGKLFINDNEVGQGKIPQGKIPLTCPIA